VLGAAGWQTGLDPRKAAAMSAGEQSSAGNLTHHTSAAYPGDTLNAYTGMLAFASLGTSSKTLMAAQNRQAVRPVGIGIIFMIGRSWPAWATRASSPRSRTSSACCCSSSCRGAPSTWWITTWSSAVGTTCSRSSRRTGYTGGSSDGRASATSSRSRCRYRSLISCSMSGRSSVR
jgi:hypothetical protein